ncbi:DUF6580 family putative transport protein [Planctomicrobium piriforme]|uniref:Uncharacterized protein n=1 Tax=Planctomicrobium piriforme TaxID=1576369 RepID=A0A1I3GX79_9PLAN|nr:DUF6580 family putative transport protein [Planctomicrobium piriforme]SFI28084.1 hypothetical protein SAMN05421753_107165 [Planctomicrobium piriforme]
MYQSNKIFLACLFAYCVAVKVLPFALLHFGLDIRTEALYPWTFTPLFAVGIFGVALFRNLKLAYAIPLAASFLGDLLCGVFAGLQYGLTEGLAFAFYPGQVVNYIALILACSTGLLLRQSRNVALIAATAVLAPTLFFAVSNFGVWAFDIGIGYPHTLAGLGQAYVAAIPFYRNALISTVAFSGLLFSPIGMSQLTRVAVARETRQVTAAAPVSE